MKVIARGLSIIFHPLFVLTYMTLILLWTNPFSFGWRHVAEADTLLIIMIMSTITLPGLAVLMMKMLGWVETFELETQAERIGPFLVAGVMYLSLYLHVTHAETFPVSLRVAVLGTLISHWGCFFINSIMKISLHATGMGGLVAITVLTKWVFGYEIGYRQTFSDFLDGFESPSSSRPDVYWVSTFNLSYRITTSRRGLPLFLDKNWRQARF